MKTDPFRDQIGGTGSGPVFPAGLPLARPGVADPARVAADVEAILRSGVLTDGPYVRRLEEETAAYLGVRHCIAVASCTTGLMLVLRASELSGDVIVPSFTFAATVHAVDWNGLRPSFADIDPGPLTLSPSSVEQAIGVHTSAILATHIYGTPCDVEGLREVAERNGLRLFFDAAHAFGSTHGGTKVGGFGDAEVFSFSPTKVVVAAEGGLIATNDDLLAERCRIGRNYGNPGDYDCRVRGSERPDVRAPCRHRARIALRPGGASRGAQPSRRRLHGSPLRHPGDPYPGGPGWRPEHVQGLHDPGRRRGSAWARMRWPPPCGSTGSRPVATTRLPCTPCTPMHRAGRPDRCRSPIGRPSKPSPFLCGSG